MKTYKPLTLLLTVVIVCSGASAEDLHPSTKGVESVRNENSQSRDPIIPNSGNDYARRSFYKFGQQNYQGAVDDSKTAITKHPQDPWWRARAYNIRYNAYIKLKDFKNALPAAIDCWNANHVPQVAEDISKLYAMQGNEALSKKYFLLSQQKPKKD